MKNVFLSLTLMAFCAPVFADEAKTFDEMASDSFKVDEAFLAPPGRPDPGRPGNPGHPGWGRPQRSYECVAQNIQRMRFLGRDFNQGRAQREAMQQCRQRSGFLARTCRVVQCRATWDNGHGGHGGGGHH